MGIIDYIEAKNAERARKVFWEDAKKFTAGALIGVTIGAATGILFAPQSGKKTREELAEGMQNASEEIKEKANEVAVNAKNAYNAKVGSRLTSIRPAIEAGLDAAEETYEDEKVATVEDIRDNYTEEDKKAAREFEKKKENVKEAASDVKEDLKKTGKDVKEDFEETGKDVKDGAKDVAEDAKKANK